MAKFDWFLQRVYGSPHVDGYGSQVLTGITTTVREVSLGRNSMYKLQPTTSNANAHAYYAILDAWNDVDVAGNSNEASVTDSTGAIIRDGEDVYITTNSRRHVLSIKMPAGAGGTMELRIIKMEPGKCLKESSA